MPKVYFSFSVFFYQSFEFCQNTTNALQTLNMSVLFSFEYKNKKKNLVDVNIQQNDSKNE